MRVGVDIGGTTIKLGFVENFKVVDRIIIPTNKDTLFQDVFEAIDKYSLDNKVPIESIGFGIPGSVKNNYINRMPNIGIGDIDLNEISKKYTKVLVKSSNDANCAALGEALVCGVKDAYFFTLGTGVGGGYILNGNVIEGTHAACGEIGHMLIDYKYQFPCSCGLKGCLETLCSATGIKRLASYHYNEYKDVTRIKMDDISAKDVCDKAKENDPLGLKVLDTVALYLARSIQILSVTNDSETYIIGGGVSACGDILTDKIKDYYKKISFYACKDVDIVLAKLGNDAGMIGAAYL